MVDVRLVGCLIAVVCCTPARAPDVTDDMGPQADPALDIPAQTFATIEIAETELVAGADAQTPPADDEPTVTATADAARPPSTNRCERFRVRVDERGRRRYQRIRKEWNDDDRRRFARLVTLVAKEMGAEPRLLRAWAMRESTYRPAAVHVLNPDIEAATAAWRRLHYSATEEAELQQVLATASARSSEYWKAKARLHQVQRFRDNVYLDDHLDFEVLAPDGSRMRETQSAWAFGYGPFGFNPAYFVPVWDARSPPWVFCQDDGLVAIVTAVWSARTAQRECRAQGFGGSYAVVNRRFSQGHCGTVSPTAKFRGRASRLGLDPDARARLGTRWKRADTDRAQIHRHMRQKAIEAGLLSAPPGA